MTLSTFSILPWTALDRLDPVVELSGYAVEALTAEMGQFPDGIQGIVVTRSGRPVASAVRIDRRIPTDGIRTFSRFCVTPRLPMESLGDPLRSFLEADARAAGARVLRISIACATGLARLLEAAGYQAEESYVQMRLTAPARDPGPLPPGVTEAKLDDVPLEDYLSMSNEAFAEVPGAVFLTPEEWRRATASPRYDHELVRILIDAGGPLGFLRGTTGVAGSSAEVDVIGLLPRGRGKGLGRWLLRRCEELLRERGSREIELLVASTNVAAFELYRAEGYVEKWRRETWSRAL